MLPLRSISAIAATCAVAAFLARLPALGPEAIEALTLGFPVARFGPTTLAVVLACGWQALTLRSRSLGRGAWRVFASTVLALAIFALAGEDIPRRRGLAMALGGALAFECARHAGSFGTRRSECVRASAILALSAAAALALLRADAAPFRRSLPAIPAASAPRAAPNLLLVTLDTTRAADLGAYGSTRDATPFLDAFAAEAWTFTNALAAAPHTHPSVATIVTGTLPREHGSTSRAPFLRSGAMTLAEHLRTLGYRTAGFLDNPWLGPTFGLARGYEHLDASSSLERVEGWLERDDPRPFFLHVHYLHPHGPYERRDSPGFQLEGIGSPAALAVGDRVSAGRIRAGEVPGRHGFSAAEIEWLHELYLSEIRAMDAEFGRLIALVEASTAQRSLVSAVTADHGEEFGERGGLHHSHTLFDELVRVPLMLRAPSLTPRRSNETVSLVDLAPTLLELAGLTELPTASGIALDSSGEDRVALTERNHQCGYRLSALRVGRWKLHVRRPMDDDRLDGPRVSFALFDLETDPHELLDRSADAPAVVDSLRLELSEQEQAMQARLGASRAPASTPERADYETLSRLNSLGYR